MARVSQTLIAGYIRYAKVAACTAILLSCLVLVGWAFGIESLMNLCPNIGDTPGSKLVGSVYSSAAILIIVCSIAFLFLLAGKEKWQTWLGMVIAGSAVATAALSQIFHEEFDPISIYSHNPASIGISFPTPTAIEVSITVVLIGVALLAYPFDKPKNSPVWQILTMCASLIPILIILGAATNETRLCAAGGCFKMSTGFAVLCVMLCSAMFLSKPSVGVVTGLTLDTTGSAILRQAGLFICLVPPLLIARTLLVSNPALMVGDGFGWVLFVFIFMILLGRFIITVVRKFNTVETNLRDELEREQSRPPVGQVEMSGVLQIPMRYKRVCLTCTNEYDDGTERCPLDSSPLSRVIDESLVGTVFAEKYRVTARLGAGGMSTVYRASHLYMDKEVAIKVLKGNAAESSDGLKRFQREARAAGALSHPGIVGVSDFGLSPDGRAFLVMDYLEGESLSSFLDKVGILRVPEVIDLAIQLCDALEVAHKIGVVHRDLKPSNIMLVHGDNGHLRAKIVDFGLAKIMDEDSQDSRKITQTGECFGSPLYMSPEQCMGKKVDQRCDIYALGCILFECLTGNPPIVGVNAADTITKHVKDRPAPFPEHVQVPKDIKLLIYKALHKEPMWRPQSVMEIKDALTGSMKAL